MKKWKIGKVKNRNFSSIIHKRRFVIIRRVRLHAGKSYLEQPIQCPLEMFFDISLVKTNTKIDKVTVK